MRTCRPVVPLLSSSLTRSSTPSLNTTTPNHHQHHHHSPSALPTTAMALGGARSNRQIGPRSSSSSSHLKLLISAILTLLLFLAALTLLSTPTTTTTLHTTSPAYSSSSSTAGSVRDLTTTFLALKSDPLRTRLDLIHKEALDHVALVNAYSSYARRLKLDHFRLLRTFDDLSSTFRDALSRLDSVFTSNDDPIDEDSLKAFEKEIKDRAKSARLLISEYKESYETQLKIQKLRDTIFAVTEHLHRARRLGDLSSAIAAGSTPKSLHCLSMRLVEERVSNPDPYLPHNYRKPRDRVLFDDPDLYHYAVFSDNVLAVSVVVNSALRNASQPRRHVFHVVTDTMNVAAFQVWFKKRPPPGGARVDVRSTADFAFLNSSYSPIMRVIEGGRYDISVLDHLKFYLPEMYPKLRKIVYLEDDVVVQKDLSGLWNVDLDGRVNGAVETCFGPFRRYSRYMNLSGPTLRGRFSPKACAWAFGVNVFDLDAWRRESCTHEYHKLLNLNKDGILWKLEDTLPLGLVTFNMNTKPLEKTWHLRGLGYNPSISMDDIAKAAVVHFNGQRKPWLDIAMNQYKQLWMKYVDSDMEYLQLCNFGV